MKTRNIKVIEASEGYYLTQLDNVPLEERIIASTLYLNEDVAHIQYKEIPIEEGDLILEQLAEANKLIKF